MYIKSLSEAFAGGYGYVQRHTPNLNLKKHAEENWKAVCVIVAIAVGAYFQWGKVGLFLAFGAMSFFYQVFGSQVEIAKKFGTKDIGILSASWAVAGTAGWLQMIAVCWATGVTVMRLWQQYQAQTVVEEEKTKFKEEKEKVEQERDKLGAENKALNERVEQLTKVLGECWAIVGKILTNNKEFVALVGDAEKLGDLSAGQSIILQNIIAKLMLISSVFANLNKDGTIPQHLLEGGLRKLTEKTATLSEQNGQLTAQLQFVDQHLQGLNKFQPEQKVELNILQERMASLESVLSEIMKQRGIQ